MYDEYNPKLMSLLKIAKNSTGITYNGLKNAMKLLGYNDAEFKDTFRIAVDNNFISNISDGRRLK